MAILGWGKIPQVIDVYVNVNYSWGIVSRMRRRRLSPVRKLKQALRRNLKQNEHGISIFNQRSGQRV